MHNWTNPHRYFSYHPRSPHDFTQTIESYTYFYYRNFEIEVLIIVNVLHILFVSVEFTSIVGWSSCALIKMVFLIYAQLDHSLFEVARYLKMWVCSMK